MRIVLFGTYDERRYPRIAVLREGLTACGLTVQLVNRPLADSTAERIEATYRPLAAIRWAGRMLAAWCGLLWRSLAIERPGAVLVGYLGVLDVVLARIRWPRATIILDHMAPLKAVAEDRGLGRAASAVLSAADRIAESAADLVLFDTQENAQLAAAAATRACVVPVGAAKDWHAVGEQRSPHAEARSADRPMGVVFFGLFTPLHGAPIIGEAMRTLALLPIRFTMIGTGQDRARTEELAGPDVDVTWYDWIPADRLPQVVANHDVCLGIFGATPKALRVVPHKVFQGAAAGCAIITLDSPAQRAVLRHSAIFVPAGDAAALAGAMKALAADRALLARYRDAARRAAQAWHPARTVAPLVRELENRIRPHVPAPHGG
ncbi:MAG: glycosyltransferase [Candidatus Binatia bacterium]